MSEPLSLRPATAADVAAIRALTREAYAKWVPIIGREPKPMTADYALAVQRRRIDLLELNGELAGLIEMIPGPDHVLIENVAVAPACQGRGFGRMLLAHAEQVTASLGHDDIRLYTNWMFAENIALYLKLGYAVGRAEVLALGTVVHMSKRVPR